MPLSARIALAFALSLAAASALQQTLMLIYDNGAEPRALPPLGICVVLIAMLMVFYVLPPSALAVPIHWLLLRGATTAPA